LCFLILWEFACPEVILSFFLLFYHVPYILRVLRVCQEKIFQAEQAETPLFLPDSYDSSQQQIQSHSKLLYLSYNFYSIPTQSRGLVV
jgi:hypothetical protein